MEEEQKIGEGVPFEHDTVQETAVEFETIRNDNGYTSILPYRNCP